MMVFSLKFGIFTGKEHRVSPSSSAKIPKACSPDGIKPSTSESQGMILTLYFHHPTLGYLILLVGA